MKGHFLSSYAFGAYVFIIIFIVDMFTGTSPNAISLALVAGITYFGVRGSVSPLREKLNFVITFLLLLAIINLPSVIESSAASTFSLGAETALIIGAFLIKGILVGVFFDGGERLGLWYSKKLLHKK